MLLPVQSSSVFHANHVVLLGDASGPLVPGDSGISSYLVPLYEKSLIKISAYSALKVILQT